jgi:hypothetical protein
MRKNIKLNCSKTYLDHDAFSEIGDTQTNNCLDFVFNYCRFTRQLELHNCILKPGSDINPKSAHQSISDVSLCNVNLPSDSVHYLSNLFPYSLEKLKIQECKLDNPDTVNRTKIIHNIPMQHTEMKSLELIIKYKAYWMEQQHIYYGQFLNTNYNSKMLYC